ncbi:MAG: bacteriohemerythrin [Desulfobulbaceae bacterium]|nr:bacteriohemerythrin [Desulfobulbaceae bacterium]
MILIRWDESFFVNIDEIDKQHEKLVGIVNTLAEAMSEGQGKTVLGKIIDELVDYTKIHFRTEERVLKLVDYPELEKHQAEHADFVQKVTDFQKGFDRGQLGLTVEVMNFLCDWVRNHIKKNDKQYALYIDEHGLRPS